MESASADPGNRQKIMLCSSIRKSSFSSTYSCFIILSKVATIGILLLSYDFFLPYESHSNTTYYVDFQQGDDSNPGTSTPVPWKHAPGDPDAIGHPGSVVINPGDIIRFKGGEKYFGKIQMKWSGTEGNPIIFDGNTNGEWGEQRAIIDGSTSLGFWTPCSSQSECGDNPNWQNIYYSYAPKGTSAFTANLTQLDQMLWLAQAPDLSDPFYFDRYSEYKPIPITQINRTSIVDRDTFYQLDPNYWNGASVLVWKYGNQIKLQSISSYIPSENKILFDDLGADPQDNNGYGMYSIINAIHLISRPGEYSFNDTAEKDGTHKIYLWPLNNIPPNSTSINISVRNFAFDINNKSNILIKGFKIQKQSGASWTDGVGIGTVNTISTSVVSNIEISDNYLSQIRHHPKSNGYGAICLQNCSSSRIHDNIIELTPSNSGIFLSTGSHCLVKDNSLVKTGYVGIYFQNMKHSSIIHNRISDSKGTHSNGISVYNNSSDILIKNNEVYRSNIAITFQNTKNLSIVNNILYGDNDASLLIASWGGNTGILSIYNNTVLNSKNHGAVYLPPGPDYECRNNIVDGGILYGNSHNLYVGLSWNQDPKYGWTLGPGELIERDLTKVFIDPGNLDFRLKCGSIAIDAGARLDLQEDIIGNPRPIGDAYDIGAYETCLPVPPRNLRIQ